MDDDCFLSIWAIDCVACTRTGVIDRICIAGDHFHICFGIAGFYSHEDMMHVWLMATSAICMEFRA